MKELTGKETQRVCIDLIRQNITTQEYTLKSLAFSYTESQNEEDRIAYLQVKQTIKLLESIRDQIPKSVYSEEVARHQKENS